MLKEYGLFEQGVKNHMKSRYGDKPIHYLSGVEQIVIGDILYISYIELASGKRYIAEAGSYYDDTMNMREANSINEVSTDITLLNCDPVGEEFFFMSEKDMTDTVFHFDLYNFEDEYYVGQCVFRITKDGVPTRDLCVDELIARQKKAVRSETLREPRLAIYNDGTYVSIDEYDVAELFFDLRTLFNPTVDLDKDMDEEVTYTRVFPIPTDIFFQVPSGRVYRTRVAYFDGTDYGSRPINDSNVLRPYISQPIQFEEFYHPVQIPRAEFDVWMVDGNGVPFPFSEIDEWNYITMKHPIQVKRFIHNVYREIKFSYIEKGHSFASPVNIKYRVNPEDNTKVDIEFVPIVG